MHDRDFGIIVAFIFLDCYNKMIIYTTNLPHQRGKDCSNAI